MRPVFALKEPRDQALSELHGLGIDPPELAELRLSDVDLERAKLALRFRGSAEVLSLPDKTVHVLRRWVALRGDTPGPLFLSLKRREGLTLGGLRLTLSKLGRPQGAQGNCERSAKERRKARDRALVHLYEAGLDVRDLVRLKVEDVVPQGVTIDGKIFSLPGAAMICLNVWCDSLRRSRGPVFVALTGKCRSISAEGLRWVLRPRVKQWRKRKRRKQKSEAPEPSNSTSTVGEAARAADPLIVLWEDLPQELRRRPPESRQEVDLTARLVEQAVKGGASLEAALELSGLSFQRFSAWKVAPPPGAPESNSAGSLRRMGVQSERSSRWSETPGALKRRLRR
jgi:site-specific recombinase XerC